MREFVLRFIILYILCLFSTNSFAQPVTYAPRDMYWTGLGATTNWSNLNNWSESPTTQTHVAVVPTSVDNVHFTEHVSKPAGYTVSVDVAAICNSFIVTGGKTPYFTGAKISLYGNLDLEPNTRIIITTIDFRAGGAATIKSSNVQFDRTTLEFNSPTGVWTLLDDLNNPSITFNSGRINTNNKSLLLRTFTSVSDLSRTLDLGASEMLVKGTWRFEGANTNLIAGTSHFIFDATGSDFFGVITQRYHKMTVKNRVSNYLYGMRDFMVDTLVGENNAVEVLRNIKSDYVSLSSDKATIQYSTINNLVLNGAGSIQFSSILDSAVFKKHVLIAYSDTAASNINRAIFYEGATLGNNFIINEAILTRGKTYGLQRVNSTVPLNVNRKINSIKFRDDANSCNDYTIFTSTNPRLSQPVLEYGGPPLHLEKTIVRGLGLTGDLTAEVDAGKNVNWTFVHPATGTTYYWVGGKGEWTDASHWASSSGGLRGSGCIPGVTDKVVVDENSGLAANDSITLYPSQIPQDELNPPRIAVCAGIEFRNLSDSLDFYVPFFFLHGDMVLHPKVRYQLNMSYTGYYGIPNAYFVGSGAIAANNARIFSNSAVESSFYIDGGPWTLMSDLKINGNIEFNQGSFNTNGYKLEINNLVSNSGLPRSLSLGNSQIYIKRSWRYSYNLNSSLLDAGTSHIYMLNTEVTNSFATLPNQLYHNITVFDGLSPMYYQGGHSANIVEFFSEVTFQSQSGTHKTLSFHKDVLIGATTTTDTLIFNKPLKITYNTNPTLTVNDSVINKLDGCSGSLSFSPTRDTYRLTFASPKAVRLNYIYLKNVTGKISAGIAGPYTAMGIDGGGNQNWTFVPMTVRDFYWVGGQGQWDEVHHWSLSPGGVSANCLPGRFDNVHFNENSGLSGTDTVYVSGTDMLAECRDMTWNNVAGTPVFANGNLSTINVYGSYTLQAGMHYNVETTLLSSNDKSVPNVLKGNGVVVNNLIMQEANAKLADKLFTSNRVSVDRTTFDTDGHDMNIYRFWTVNASSSKVFLHSSEIVLNKDAYTVIATAADTSATWHFSATGFTGTNNLMDAGTSHIIIKGLFIGGNVNRYHNITFEPSTQNSILRGAVYINTLIANNPLTIDYFNSRTVFRTIDYAALLKGMNVYYYGTSSSNPLNGGGTINKLLLGSGYTYYFPITLDTIFIGEVSSTTLGDCYTETLLIGTTWTGGPLAATIKISNPATMDRVTVSRVNNHGSPVTLRGSFSYLYQSVGWVYADSPGRTLYWVGGGGAWDDVAHWSLAPGGAGGECIPSPWDDAIFDDASGFTSSNRTIQNSKYITALVRNLSFKGTSNPVILFNSPTFHLNVHGNLYLQPGMTYPNTTRFRSIKQGNTITSNGVYIGAWEFNSTHFGESTASWTFIDDIKSLGSNASFTHKAGELNFNGKKIAIGSFQANVPDATTFEPRTLNIENSTLQLYSMFMYFGQNIKSTNSRIQFTATGSSSASFKSGYNLSYDTIVNSTTINNSMEGSFNANVLKLNGGTRINGSNNFKEVYLAKQSYVVTFEADSTQTINSVFSVSGSPCHVSKIYSSSNTVPAKLSLPFIPTVDYVEFRGINATDKKIVAERNSDNGGNNTNITFIDGTGGLVGLGGDTTLCNNGFPYTLGTAGFFPGPEAEFEWFDSKGASLGKTSTINVFKPGKYSVKVDYKSAPVNCIRYDTIEVTASAPIAFVTDYDIVHPECLRDSAVITIKSPLGAQYSYAMQDTAVSTPLVFQTNPVLERGKAGVYYLVVKEGECTSDSVIIKIREPYIPGIPTDIIINDTTTCSGYSINLSPTTTTIGINPVFHWYADAGLSVPITAGVSAEGVLGTPVLTDNTTYYVTISSDTLCENPAGQAHAVQITVTPSPVIDALSANTVSCTSNNGEIVISASGGIAPYRYSVNNGISWSLSNIIGGLAMGSYTVVVEDAGGCKSIPQIIILEGGVTSNTAARSFSDSPLGLAEHRLKGCLYLGALDTLEIQAVYTPSIFANTAINDDGLSVPVNAGGYTDLLHADFFISADGKLNVKAQVSNFTANVAQAIGWIDFNNNGIFDPSEASVPVSVAAGGNGSISLVWAGAVNNISVGKNYLRVRLSSAPFTSANAAGELPDGEVEDYRLDFMPYSLSKMSEVNNADYHSLDTARIGDTISYKLTVINNLGVDIVIDKLFDTIPAATILHDTYPVASTIVGHYVEWTNIALAAGKDSTFIIRTIATDIPQPDSIIYNIAFAVRGNDTINSALNCNIDSLLILPMPIDANDDCVLTLKNEAIKMRVILNDTLATGFDIVIRTAPKNGTATVAMSDSTILYTPNTGYVGLDSMMYSLSLNGIERDSAMVRIAVISLAGDFSFCPSVDTVISIDTISGVNYKWYNEVGTHLTSVSGKYNDSLSLRMGARDTVFYISANYGQCNSTNKVAIPVHVDKLRQVPDIRILVCPNPDQKINLASYLDTIQFKSVTWIPLSGSPALHADTLYTSEMQLLPGQTIMYNYSVVTYCGVSEATMYLQTPRKEQSLPESFETRICYLNADNIQLKPIIGLEGQGAWTYNAAVAPYVKQTQSGAYVFDGKLYYGSSIGDIEVEFTYTPTATDCYTGVPIVVKVILTDEIV